jgi:type IX secretion system PorP/SprF family membrane protein
MNKKFFISTVFVIAFAISKMPAQDVHFSQQQMSPLTLNPALAGANYMGQGAMAYKDQWKAANARFTTMYGSWDMRFMENRNKGHFGAGLSFYSDKAGDGSMSTNYINLALGYHVKTNKYTSLGLAVQPSYGNRNVNTDNMNWGAQFDGSGFNSALSSGEVREVSSYNYFDLNSGVVFTYKSSEHYMTANDELNINAGFAVSHILRPKYSFYGSASERLPMKYTFFANALIGVPNTKFGFMPGLYVNVQGPQKEILAGTYYRYLLQDHSVYTGIKKGSAFSLGTFYRVGDAFVAKALFEYAHYAIGFSYDLTLSSYTSASKGRGGFEVTLRYVTPNPFGHKAPKSRI